MLQSAGGVHGEQPGDALLAFFGLAGEPDLAVDDCASEACGVHLFDRVCLTRRWGGDGVLVDEAAEPVVSADRGG